MKQQKHVLTTSNTKSFKLFIWPQLILAAFLCFQSCKNDIETINAFADDLEIPDQSAKNIEFQLSDSGLLKVIVKAPLAERYMQSSEDEGPKKVFPKGIEVLFYNDSEALESKITAGYAEHWEEKDLWRATDSVVAQNIISGERLDTEELYWNAEKKEIYSLVFTKITNEDGVFFGEEGFESDQDLENYKLIGSRGTVKVKDEEIE